MNFTGSRHQVQLKLEELGATADQIREVFRLADSIEYGFVHLSRMRMARVSRLGQDRYKVS